MQTAASPSAAATDIVGEGEATKKSGKEEERKMECGEIRGEEARREWDGKEGRRGRER